MFGHQFYHSALRKYVIMFGNMFNDIDVVRYNNNVEVQTIRVPIAYGPAEKFLTRIAQDSSRGTNAAVQLPRMAFEITGFTYDPTRGLNRLTKNSAIGAGNNTLRSQFTPVPYDIEFALYGMFANNEDAVQVTEQILPFFRPEFTHSVKIVPEMGQYFDIPTILTGVSFEDTYDSDFQTRRAIIYTYNFTVKGYVFGPVTNRGVIKRTKVDFTIPAGNTAASGIGSGAGPQSKLTLTPGLLANGSPTSNSAASVALSNITANSNYGFAFDSENFFDGVDRHSEN
jgi:hypothetical protein